MIFGIALCLGLALEIWDFVGYRSVVVEAVEAFDPKALPSFLDRLRLRGVRPFELGPFPHPLLFLSEGNFLPVCHAWGTHQNSRLTNAAELRCS